MKYTLLIALLLCGCSRREAAQADPKPAQAKSKSEATLAEAPPPFPSEQMDADTLLAATLHNISQRVVEIPFDCTHYGECAPGLLDRAEKRIAKLQVWAGSIPDRKSGERYAKWLDSYQKVIDHAREMDPRALAEKEKTEKQKWLDHWSTIYAAAEKLPKPPKEK